MIPTSIDGTDITGATIDGTDVQEITVDGQTVFTATPASLVAQYRFENNVEDSINNFDGVDNTGLGYTGSSEEGSFAKLFDTNGGGVDISAAPSNSSFTFVGYVYFENDVGDKQHFGGNAGTSGDSVLMRITGIGGDYRFKVGGTQEDFSSSNIVTGSWIHVGFGYDSSTNEATVYENGSILANKTYNEGSLSSITDKLGLGVFGVGQSLEPLDGRMDDVRYYSKKLDSTEISNLYNTGSI